jgi:hypothetical protein
MFEFKELIGETDSNYVLGEGLEPHFRVLFSAIFQSVSLGNFHQGRNLWKAAEGKVWSFLVDLRQTVDASLALQHPSTTRFHVDSTNHA